MKKLSVIVCVVLVVAAATIALSQGFKNINQILTGYEETPQAISTEGNGVLRARISNDETQIQYELSYADLESAVTQAHIHFGATGTSGGISMWLCSNLASPPTPPGVQACPTPSGTITGTLTAADVVGPTGQGIAAGEFAEVIRAMRAGATYVNVHTVNRPAGEIRKQIDGNSGHH